MEACYRHPGRETGVGCSSCGRPICPDCMTTTSVGMRCPECARQTTQVRTAASLQAEPRLTYGLIGLNVIVAVGAVLSGASIVGPGSTDSLLHALGAVSPATVADGQLWRLVTAGFLHGGAIHLLLNMYALYILGGLLEPSIGKLRFVLIYLVSLLAGSFGAVALGESAVGASGAVFGLMGAAFVVMRHRGINPMQSGLPLILGINLLFTFTFASFISVGGHVGGLIGGFLAAALLFELGERVRVPRAVSAALVVALGVLVVVGSVAVSSGA